MRFLILRGSGEFCGASITLLNYALNFRPDVMTLRVLGKNLINFDAIGCTTEWAKSQCPKIILKHLKDYKENNRWAKRKPPMDKTTMIHVNLFSNIFIKKFLFSDLLLLFGRRVFFNRNAVCIHLQFDRSQNYRNTNLFTPNTF